jgi:hypothetical protein
MNAPDFEAAMARLKDALTRAPEQISAANQALRVELDGLRRNPQRMSREQMDAARKELHTVAELARLRQHTARRLQQALTPAGGDAYSRFG